MAWLGLPQALGQSMTAPADPFVWGQGGQMLTPEQIAQRRNAAQSMLDAGADYSPIGHWTQGLARVAQGLMGGIERRKADKAANASAERGALITQALLEGRKGVAAQAMADPYAPESVRALGEKVWDRENPKPAAPTEFERALAGAGIDPRGPEGVGLYRQRASTMALPSPQFVPDGMGGGQWVVPPSGSVPQGVPTAPVGALTLIPDEPATMSNTPSPALGDNGLPALLTPQQYQVTVDQMGKDATDAWMARNGIQMGGR